MTPSFDPASAGAPRVRVVLADDHAMVREGIRRLLCDTPDLHVVAEVGGGDELLAVLGTQPADVAVVDLSMPGLAGVELIGRVKALFPHVAVLVLTMHVDTPHAMRALRAGASGYVTKDSAGAELVQAVRKVARGGGYVGAELAEQLAVGLQTLRDRELHECLSPRELQVLRRLVAGQRPVDIAAQLHLSIKTVSTHKARILEKMGLENSAALIRYGLQHQLADDTA